MLLIAAPTPAELYALAPDCFSGPEQIQEMTPQAVQLKTGKALFLATGPGPINAAVAASLCLGAHREIKAVLLAGLAAAFDLEQTPLRSTWIVSEEIWPEYGLNDGVSVIARAFSLPLWTEENGDKIYDRINLAAPETLDFLADPELWPQCASLTVAGVTASFSRREYLKDHYNARLENMEGFAVAWACARARVPCMEARVVERLAGPRGANEKDTDGAMRQLEELLPSLNLINPAKKCH